LPGGKTSFVAKARFRKAFRSMTSSSGPRVSGKPAVWVSSWCRVIPALSGGRRRELLADRGDVEQRVGGERDAVGAVGQAVTLVQDHLAVLRHHDRARVAETGELDQIAVERGAERAFDDLGAGAEGEQEK
jgi:hypothetical protein